MTSIIQKWLDDTDDPLKPSCCGCREALAACCANEDEARDIARKVLGPKADGDQYGVPSIVDLVNMLIEQLTAEKRMP